MTTTHRILKTLLLIAVLACLVWLFATPPANATSGVCSVKQAKRAATKAHKALIKAKAADKEARRVLSATKAYSALYRPDVGRWVQLARKCKWPWSRIPWLMRQLEQESKGQPCPMGSQDGPLQIIPYWWSASASPNAAEFWESKHLPFPWTPTNVRQTFIHARVMDPSNWWIVGAP